MQGTLRHSLNPQLLIGSTFTLHKKMNFFVSRKLHFSAVLSVTRKNINRKYHSFQHQILSDILCLNKILFKFGKVKSPLCSFCKSVEKKWFIYLVIVYEHNIIESNSDLLCRLYYYPWWHTAGCHSWFYRHQYWTRFTDKTCYLSVNAFYIKLKNHKFAFFNF